MRIVIAILILSASFSFAQDGTQENEMDSLDSGNQFVGCWGNQYYAPEIREENKINVISRLNFNPLIANPYEARIGFIGQPSEERLRMDIGASFDLFKLSKQGTFGIDMMTYTRLRSEGRFKFPVETTDYYFGVNSAFSFYGDAIFGRIFNGVEKLRIRLAHISSHLIDGYTTDNEFITPPFVYSREFLEVIYKVDHDYYTNYTSISPYIGVNYIFSKIPRNIESFELISGIEYRKGLTDNISIEAGYNFTLKGLDDTYYGVNSGQAGILYNFTKNRAIFVGVYLYDGLSMHGMFFNQKDSYIGIGTQIYYF
ncbi:MAG: hypothetical protein CVV25_04520 [Ignavibacteriae bacterium HGW-Ignavibacteriae-4]|jgi:hypothetical protein|nr:MAG: hypothetical protein CVV25_04520 [Ignavibacteriae bacterium HGW-Ignavibacteriae-4]